MPIAIADEDNLFDEYLEWPEYDVADGEILQSVVLEHTERHAEDFNTAWRQNDLLFSFPDSTGPQNRYQISADGDIISAYWTNDIATDGGESNLLQRHETITTHRLNALVGRANKTQELIDYVQEFDQFDAAETVFRRYCEAPVLDGIELEKTIMQQHGGTKRDQIKDAKPYLFNRAGAVTVSTDEQYEKALDAVVHGEPYGGEMPEAVKIDYELCTKGRDMIDWYDFEDSDARKSARHTHRTLMGTAAEYLGMKDVYDEVMTKNRLVHGIWPQTEA